MREREPGSIYSLMNQAPTEEINKPLQNQKAYEEGQIVLKSQKLQLCQSGLAS
jgi:hypothetical protein